MKNKRWAAVCLSALLMVWGVHFATNHIQQFESIKGHTAPATEGPSAMIRSLRPNFPYSVIAGGVYSPRELQFAHSKDAVVRAHYADFDTSRAKLVRLTDDRFQYVSYRVKEQIYWTRKKLRIPKGELLMTDGEHYARTRCGNRLSDKPNKTVSAHEPSTALLSLPPVNPKTVATMAMADGPVLGDAPTKRRMATADSGAGTPLGDPSMGVHGEPPVPMEAVWGGQPIAAGGLIAGAPTIAFGGSSVGGLSPVGQPNPTPVVTPQTPTADVTPVPEPGSGVYLFLISLGVSIWALLRMSPKDEAQ